jgi:hypothetical protein
VRTPSTRSTIFGDNFEAGLSWTKNGDVTWYTGSPRKGSHSVRLRRTGSIEKVIPTTGYRNISVSFSMGSNSLENENVQALYYNGSSWQILAQINDGDQNDNNRLNNYRIMLPSTADGRADFALRFKINGSAANDYGFVDDVEVTGTRR